MTEIVTQKPDQTKTYTEPKASDHALQLDSIKWPILLKKALKSYKIIILNS